MSRLLIPLYESYDIFSNLIEKNKIQKQFKNLYTTELTNKSLRIHKRENFIKTTTIFFFFGLTSGIIFFYVNC